MNKHFKIILNCIGVSLITFFIVNTISFLIDLYKVELVDDWSFKWEHGTFFINNNPSGLQFGDGNAFIFLFLTFFAAMAVSYRKRKLKPN